MNFNLILNEKNNNIFHISGCNLYDGTIHKRINDKSFLFSKYPQFWGWATWKDRWRYFEKKPKKIIQTCN